MFSPEYIKEMNRRAAARARRNGIEPHVITEDERASVLRGEGVPGDIPFIGSYKPKGWERLRTHFVDISGFGEPGEPALTIHEFYRRVVPGRGYAIVSAGQFQAYIAEYQRKGKENENHHEQGTFY